MMTIDRCFRDAAGRPNPSGIVPHEFQRWCCASITERRSVDALRDRVVDYLISIAVASCVDTVVQSPLMTPCRRKGRYPATRDKVARSDHDRCSSEIYARVR